MKILIVTGIYPPDIGGPATYVSFMAGAMAKMGHQVHVITYSDQLPKGEEVKQKLYTIEKVLRSYPWFVRHALFGIKIFFATPKADLVFAQDPMNSGIVSVLSAMFWRKKAVLKIVGDYAWEQGVGRFGVTDVLDDFLTKKQHGRVRFLQKIERFVANRANQIIVPSHYLKGVVSSWGVKSPISVVYNGISASKSPEKGPKRPSTGRFLTVGRLVPWKGIEALIEAFSGLPNFSLDIVGSGPEEATLKQKVEDLNVASRVRFLGSVEHGKLEESYATYDALLLNTSYEGFSHQIIEAMNAGLVVITTDAGGNKEIVVDHENSLVVELNNVTAWREAIVEIGDDDLRAKLSDEALRAVSNFTVDKMIAGVAQILKQIV